MQRLGVRHLQAMMTFSGLVLAYSLRVNLSVGIVAMTDKMTTSGNKQYQTFMTFSGLVMAYSIRVNLSVGIVAMTDKMTTSCIEVLEWDSSQKGIILSSIFWGYVVLPIPAGHLARTIGPKYVLFCAMMCCSLATLLSPYIALNYNWVFFCLTRFVIGLGQGSVFPSINAHVAKWAPPSEQNRIFAGVFVGTQVGATLTLFVAGLLAASSWGWPSIFYVTGLCSLIWCLAWLFLGANSPDTHPSISDCERNYIKSELINSS
ncbi:hypothetical protein J6590_001904 [Homalodisca vitripennis]|nr:hypothetical protein J6590_001904 [Homalodisca vitripennis]